MRRLLSAFALLFACQLGMAEAQTYPVLTVPTAYTFSPYLDCQVGGATGAGPEGRPIAPDGWLNNGTSNLAIFPIGDGSLVQVHAQFVVRTDDIPVVPTACNRNYGYMLLAGMPPLDHTILARIPEAGFAGNFEGLQLTTGTTSANFTVDCTDVMNDANGGRCFMVCSFFGTAPYNAWWTYDGVASEQTNFPNRCWFNSNKNSLGKSPFRLVASLWYETSWANVAPWLAAQETAGLVVQINPAPAAGARPKSAVRH